MVYGMPPARPALVGRHDRDRPRTRGARRAVRGAAEERYRLAPALRRSRSPAASAARPARASSGTTCRPGPRGALDSDAAPRPGSSTGHRRRRAALVHRVRVRRRCRCGRSRVLAGRELRRRAAERSRDAEAERAVSESRWLTRQPSDPADSSLYLRRWRTKGEAVITQIDDMPAGTIGLQASGKLSRADYREVWTGTARCRRLRQTPAGVPSHQFEGLEPGAWIEDVETGLRVLISRSLRVEAPRIGHRRRLGRKSDADVRVGASWGEVMVYPLDRLADAKASVAGLAPDSA